jgi:hypothetical protein
MIIYQLSDLQKSFIFQKAKLQVSNLNSYQYPYTNEVYIFIHFNSSFY